jgi:hypothetical protein
MISVLLIVVLSMATYVYMKRPQFGALPSGDRLARMEKSPHFKDGRFHNRIEKPTITKGYSIIGQSYKTLFGSFPRRTPVDSLPSVKTDLKALPADEDFIVWFGHSSVFIQGWRCQDTGRPII